MSGDMATQNPVSMNRQDINRLITDLEILHGNFLGHAVHTRNAGSIEENGRAQAVAWESAAGAIWRLLCKYDRVPRKETTS